MNKTIQKTILITSLFLSYFAVCGIETAPTLDMSIHRLQEYCSPYPEHAGSAPASFLSRDAFIKTIEQCTAANKLMLRSDTLWLDHTSPFKVQIPDFAPFVQKLLVPQQSNIYFFGDLHGNIHSLLRTLDYLKKQQVLDDNFHIISSNTYLLFLGDYVDRGEYGIEVIYTLMKLRMANPGNVILIRGNHEDGRLNEQYGFTDELYERADFKEADLTHIENWYATMPMALFLGVKNDTHTDYIQCCHGGPELGYDASRLLASSESVQFQEIVTLDRADNVRNLPLFIKKDVLKYVPEYEIENFTPRSPTIPITIGLMWADLIEDPRNYRSAIVDHNEGRGWVHGKELTHYWFKEQSGSYHTLHAIIRGHQHYGNMLQQLIINKGLVSLWNNTAYTVLSAPVAGKQFPFDACTHLKTAANFNNWVIKPIVVNENRNLRA